MIKWYMLISLIGHVLITINMVLYYILSTRIKDTFRRVCSFEYVGSLCLFKLFYICIRCTCFRFVLAEFAPQQHDILCRPYTYMGDSYKMYM